MSLISRTTDAADGDVSKSLSDFWTNFRLATRMLTTNVTADAPMVDLSDVAGQLRRQTFWLTPKSVAKFNPRDFEFLDEQDREELVVAVEAFLAAARDVSREEVPTEAQVEAALPPFQGMIEILRPDRYNDAAALILGTEIEQRLAGRMPATVVELRFETGIDSVGGPGLWIWVIFKDEVNEKDQLLPNARLIQKLLWDTVEEMDVVYWPFVRFRTESDLEAAA